MFHPSDRTWAALSLAASVLCLMTFTPNTLRAADDVMQTVGATFKITNPDSTATALVFSRTTDTEKLEMILVTAAHVLEKAKGDECRIVLRRQQKDGSYVRREFPIKIRDKDEPLWQRHPKADVAAMRIELPAHHSIVPLSPASILDAKSGNQLKMGDEVWALGFPAQLESSRAGFPVLRRGTVASFPLKATDKTRTYMVDYNTFSGDSGGPIFKRNATTAAPTIVGLVHGQHRHTTKSTTPIEERTVHRTMNLAIVIHAKFIRETIDLIQ